MNIFLIESPSPNDLLEDRNEANSLKQICRMFEHRIKSFQVYSKKDLENIISFIKDIEISKDDYLCIHFSCHGNGEGLYFGNDFLDWEDFFYVVKPILEEKSLEGKYSFVISACGTNSQELTKEIEDYELRKGEVLYIPIYLIVYDEEEVLWKDALLSWTILYHQLSEEIEITDEHLNDIFEKIRSVDVGELSYFVWNDEEEEYDSYTP